MFTSLSLWSVPQFNGNSKQVGVVVLWLWENALLIDLILSLQQNCISPMSKLNVGLVWMTISTNTFALSIVLIFFLHVLITITKIQSKLQAVSYVFPRQTILSFFISVWHNPERVFRDRHHRARMTLASFTQIFTYTHIFSPQGTALSQKGKCTLPYLQNVFPSLKHEHFPDRN